MIADAQWRAGHRLGVGAVEHRDPPIRTVDADAMRNGIQDRMQNGRTPPGFVLGAGKRADVGRRHCPAAIRQRVGADIDDVAVGADAANGHGPGAVGIALVSDECLAFPANELIAHRKRRDQIVKRHAGIETLGRKSEQFRKALIAEQQRAVRRECRQSGAQRGKRRSHAHQGGFGFIARRQQRRCLDRANHVAALRQRRADQVVAPTHEAALAETPVPRAIGGQERGKLRLRIARPIDALIGGGAHCIFQLHSTREAVRRQSQRGAVR